MSYRSLFAISRLTLNISNIASRCLVVSYNNQLICTFQQHNRYLTQNTSNQRPPGRLRRFFRWFKRKDEPTDFETSTIPPPVPLTTMQRVKRLLAVAPPIERFFLRSHIIEDEDLARLISKTAAVTIYAFIGVTTLGTLGVDTKPLLAGIGITGFTIGFALKEVATNFIAGIFLVINKPFIRGCRIKIHGSGGGIEGLVHYIDIRYVHLKTKDRGIVMVPSAIVYTNAFTVFPADDEANAGFLDMTKPPTSDPTKPAQQLSSSSTSNITVTKEKQLKMNFDPEPVGSFKKK
ncbi:unnamed protein product [Rotaria sordida]|uniref:Uncharacterized protein n=1 Tax=Rotaria sordida TaxID=392033 RepID=A0A818FBJ7_9BILA|nr:unnamed protein product [Rotaria sordida]CAF0839992.1 unnamed protein product [Rotaria sordida]CAF0840231.1 unnamed protein product [Rotaria sordida]CAF3472614.1 unnamed protein product [Rotaria sordida]CAF3563479.1 unnamed protein product [Rotaria sordida]